MVLRIEVHQGGQRRTAQQSAEDCSVGIRQLLSGPIELACGRDLLQLWDSFLVRSGCRTVARLRERREMYLYQRGLVEGEEGMRLREDALDTAGHGRPRSVEAPRPAITTGGFTPSWGRASRPAPF